MDITQQAIERAKNHLAKNCTQYGGDENTGTMLRTSQVLDELEIIITDIVKIVEEATKLKNKETIEYYQLRAKEDEREKIKTLPVATFTFQATNPLSDIAQGQSNVTYANGYEAGAREMKQRILQTLTPDNQE